MQQLTVWHEQHWALPAIIIIHQEEARALEVDWVCFLLHPLLPKESSGMERRGAILRTQYWEEAMLELA
jgi:hypothetical protein